MAMSPAAELVLYQQLDTVGNMIKQNSTGEYYISDLSIVDLGSDKLRLYTWLMDKLVINFPEYQWKSSESLQPKQRGMLISWRLKYVADPRRIENGRKSGAIGSTL